MVFHLPGAAVADPSRIEPFYLTLIEGLRLRGGLVEVVAHDRALVADQVAADHGFHILDHGNLRHPRALNSGVAYIYPFRNMDPWGIRAQSSIAAMRFDAASVDAARARVFADRLRKRLVAARVSRYEQPEAVQSVPKGCIAVFLQSEAHRGVAETCYLTMKEMVGAVVARADPRPIVIKPHPRDFSEDTHKFLRKLARRDARVIVSMANIHDILGACAVVVTINSAVGIEAAVHNRPVVLCGHADFHHAAVTVRAAGEMEAGLARAEAGRWSQDAFLYWYFALNCLAGGRPSLVDDFLAKIAATGFDMAAIGLAP